MKKKVAMLLTAAMCVSLAACGDKPADSGDQTGTAGDAGTAGAAGTEQAAPPSDGGNEGGDAQADPVAHLLSQSPMIRQPCRDGW